MKKIALVLAVLLCALPMMAFAEVAVTGSVSFSIGDSSSSEPVVPAYSASKSATATLSVATDDEKVVATVGLDLLPAATSTYAYGDNNQYEPGDNGGYSDEYVAGYADYKEIEAIVDFWLDHEDDETVVDEETIWASNHNQAGLMTAINNVSTDDIAYYDSGDLAIKSAKAVGTELTSTDKLSKFVFDDTAAGQMAAIKTAAYDYVNKATAVAINKILAEAESADIKNIGETTAVNEVKAFVTGMAPEDYDAYAAKENDLAVLKAAYDLEKALAVVKTPVNGDPTVTTALSYITSATLAFKDVAGLLDITFDLAGGNVAAGSISVDGAGHTSTAVASYPSIMVGLSSGVVDGLNAGVTVFIDDNDAQDAVSDDFYTWADEADDKAEPVFGLGINGGYSMALGDMTVGADVAVGLYDFTDLAWAFSVAPSFSGFGANAGVQFDMGLDMMYLMVCADYTIMGITPNVAFHYLNATGDNVLSYSASPSSVMGKFKDSTGGMLMAGGIDVDLTELIGMGITVGGGMEYGMTGAAAGSLAYNAGVSAANLVDGLTVGFDWSADTVAGSTCDWSVSASYAYSIATLSASFGNAYDSGDDANYTTWSVGAAVSF